MPLGLNRTDLNTTGIDYLHGSPVTLPHQFGNTVNWVVNPAHFGNVVLLPLNLGNQVNWAPSPAHYGNIFGQVFEDDLLLEDGVTTFGLENGSGNILLEN